MLAPKRHLLALCCIAAAGCAARGASRASAAAGGVGEAPLDVTRAFYAALHAGDARRAASLVDASNAVSVTASFVKISRAYADLESAVRDRFGAEAARTIGYAARVAAEDEALSVAEEDRQGDRALIRSGDRTLARLRLVAGTWRIALEDELVTERGAAALALEAEASRQAAAEVVPVIRGGLFDAPEDALQAFRNEFEAQMGRASPDARPVPEGPGVEL